jgi:hypothetical protein
MASADRSSSPASLSLWQQPSVRFLRRGVFLIGIALLAGLVAGLVAGGIGSRLAMRIVALLAPPEDQGALTDADARVGEISLEGTLFLLLAGATLGLFGGLLYLAVRRWMPGGTLGKGLAFGALLLILFGHVIIEGRNPDFRQFVPSPVSVGLFASLFIAFGLIAASIVERMDRGGGGMPRNRYVSAGGYAVIAIVAAAGLRQDIDALTAIF